MKTLWLGDPHVTVSNIDESDSVLEFVNDTALKHNVDRIVILGDLFHTFSVVRTEVMDLWIAWLDTLSEAQQLIVLLGNHDMANSGNDDHKSNALSPLKLMKKRNLHIIDSPLVDGPYAFIPYMHDNNRFVNTTHALANEGAKILICHQTFQGSKYESGIYAPDGIDPDDLANFTHIISGHIHSRQRFGKIIYPGTARWLTASDANEPKGLWLTEHDDLTGKILKEEFISTNNVCTPLISLIWREGEEEPTMAKNARVHLELVGSSEWIDKQKTKFKGSVSIKSKITDKSKLESRKTGGSLHNFIENYFEITNGINRKDVLDYMKKMEYL